MLNNHLKQSIIYVLGIWKSLKEQTKEKIIDEFSRVFRTNLYFYYILEEKVFFHFVLWKMMFANVNLWLNRKHNNTHTHNTLIYMKSLTFRFLILTSFCNNAWNNKWQIKWVEWRCFSHRHMVRYAFSLYIQHIRYVRENFNI